MIYYLFLMAASHLLHTINGIMVYKIFQLLCLNIYVHPTFTNRKMCICGDFLLCFYTQTVLQLPTKSSCPIILTRYHFTHLLLEAQFGENLKLLEVVYEFHKFSEDIFRGIFFVIFLLYFLLYCYYSFYKL